MKKIYGLIVEDTLEKLKNDEKKNLNELFAICTLDEVYEIVNRFKMDSSSLTEQFDRWLDRRQIEISEFIDYISSSNYSNEYLDSNYSIDFLNSVRRLLGLEIRFYKDSNNIINQVEFMLDDNELRINSIIVDSIRRQRDKNSRFRGYKDSNEERKYQLFYNQICLKDKKPDESTLDVKKEIDAAKLLRKKIEKSLKSMSKEEVSSIIKKDRSFNYMETKDQLLQLIESYGYSSEMVDEVDINDLYDLSTNK